ncbi:RidA family protein [uncultured Ruegeria sp.]|uniref:RidA family protein n=1 Tax=uncultured Ruegeria sp. TaxID=259304 RepID=UPI00261E0785|nr:RidA family protein [uncultured Ruegeria sp.]
MITRLAPDTLRTVPEQYQGIYVHGTQITASRTLVCLSGQIGVALNDEALEGFEWQCHQTMSNVEALLTDAGLETADIPRVIYYVTGARFLPVLSNIRQDRWNQGRAPTVTTLVAAGLAAPDLLVEIEVTAAR